MQKIYRSAIVGGGAAGLMAAVELTRGENPFKGGDVVILEKNDRVGKKLIATGNGQGNLTNASIKSQNYYGDKDFINSFLSSLEKVDLVGYLEKLGIYLTCDKQGKMYPLSKQASAVLDIIRANLKDSGVSETTNSEVKDIKYKNGVFEIITKDQTYYSKSVVLATGGTAAKQFGTDGTAYKLAQRFDHTLTKVYPSLVQLKTDTTLIRALKGLKETARVVAKVDGKEIKSATGDLLFTEFGVSGSSIFSLSAGVTDKENVSLKIEFLPELSLSEVQNLLEQREKIGYFDRENLLTGIINKRVGQAVLKTAKSGSAKDVAFALKNFTLKVTGNLGFNYAQVTKGGIKTAEVNPASMQSRLQKGLYIVGETLDIDGDCGGYNLTFAFVSAILAARAIKENKGYLAN